MTVDVAGALCRILKYAHAPLYDYRLIVTHDPLPIHPHAHAHPSRAAHSCCTPSVRPSRRFSDTLLLAAWEAPLRAFSPRDLGTLVWALAAGRTLPEEAWMDELWWVAGWGAGCRQYDPDTGAGIQDWETGCGEE